MKQKGLSLNELHAACLAAVPEVLETMFFEPLVAGPEPATLSTLGPLDYSRVAFVGSARGYLAIAAHRDLAAALAGTFLAIDDQCAPPADAELVLGEIANIICGDALGRCQPDGEFRLSTPHTQLARPAAEVAAERFAWLKFPLHGGPLFVDVMLEPAE